MTADHYVEFKGKYCECRGCGLQWKALMYEACPRGEAENAKAQLRKLLTALSMLWRELNEDKDR